MSISPLVILNVQMTFKRSSPTVSPTQKIIIRRGCCNKTGKAFDVKTLNQKMGSISGRDTKNVQ